MNKFKTIVHDGEVFVFYLGRLIYKRWFHRSEDVQDKDRSILLDKYGPVKQLPNKGDM